MRMKNIFYTKKHANGPPRLLFWQTKKIVYHFLSFYRLWFFCVSTLLLCPSTTSSVSIIMSKSRYSIYIFLTPIHHSPFQLLPSINLTYKILLGDERKGECGLKEEEKETVFFVSLFLLAFFSFYLVKFVRPLLFYFCLLLFAVYSI